MTGSRLVAMAALACLAAMPGRAADGTVIEFHGHRYRLPLRQEQVADPVYFGTFGDYAVEASLPAAFWNGLYPKEATVTGWQLEQRSMPLRLTLPDDLTVWTPGQPAGHPPVPQKLASNGVQRGVNLWTDTESRAAFGRLLLTYDGRADFYVVCDRRQIWNQEDSCDVVWNDAGVLGSFPIYGNLLTDAPGFLDAFIAATRPPG